MNCPLYLFAVRIEQKFIRVKPLASFRSVGSVGAVAVQLSGTHLRQITVPHHVSLLRQRHPRGLTLAQIVEQTQLNLVRVLGVQGEVHAFPIPGCAQWIRPPGPDDWLRKTSHRFASPERDWVL